MSKIKDFLTPGRQTTRGASGLLPSIGLYLAGSELIVPKSAVMWTGKRSVVYVKVDGGFEMRDVELGESLGESYILKEGLEEGEEVVSKGTFTIDAAAQLNNKYSMMNRPESEPGTPNLQQYATF